MKRIMFIMVLLLTACGHQSSCTPGTCVSADTNNAPPSAAGPAFQAYGITPDPSLPRDMFYAQPGPQHSDGPVYMQPLTPGTLTKIAANFMYYGDPRNYDTKNSSFMPQQAGLYYIDEQVEVQGTYKNDYVTYKIQLNVSGHAQLWYTNTWKVQQNAVTRNKTNINTLVCLNGTTDHVEALVSVDDGTDTTVVSQESQFEGYYVGPCSMAPKVPGT